MILQAGLQRHFEKVRKPLDLSFNRACLNGAQLEKRSRRYAHTLPAECSRPATGDLAIDSHNVSSQSGQVSHDSLFLDRAMYRGTILQADEILVVVGQELD